MMDKATKASKHSSSLIQELLDEVSPLEMEQTKMKMHIAARIEDLMKTKGLSKSKFAEKLGKNPSEITKWLSGTQNFTVDVLTEIAFTLGLELSALLSKQPVQAVYRQEIEVKSVPVSTFIQLRTPFQTGRTAARKLAVTGKWNHSVYTNKYQG